MVTIEENQTYTEPDNHEARNNVGQAETSHLMAPSSADGGRDGRIALRKARIETARNVFFLFDLVGFTPRV